LEGRTFCPTDRSGSSVAVATVRQDVQTPSPRLRPRPSQREGEVHRVELIVRSPPGGWDRGPRRGWQQTSLRADWPFQSTSGSDRDWGTSWL